MFSQVSVCPQGGVRGRGTCMVGGACAAGGGGAWKERRSLQRTVRILPECILVLKQYCTCE